MAAVTGIALAEGCAEGKHGPVGHQPFSHIRNISGQLDPLIFAQTLHVAFLPVKRPAGRSYWPVMLLDSDDQTDEIIRIDADEIPIVSHFNTSGNPSPIDLYI